MTAPGALQFVTPAELAAIDRATSERDCFIRMFNKAARRPEAIARRAFRIADLPDWATREFCAANIPSTFTHRYFEPRQMMSVNTQVPALVDVYWVAEHSCDEK